MFELQHKNNNAVFVYKVQFDYQEMKADVRLNFEKNIKVYLKCLTKVFTAH